VMYVVYISPLFLHFWCTCWILKLLCFSFYYLLFTLPAQVLQLYEGRLN
jgi:hypothetical protein